MTIKQQPEEKDMSTVALSWENKRKLQEISDRFKELGRESKMSYDETVCFLFREHEKQKHLMKRIEDLYSFRGEFVKKVNDYMQRTGSKLPIDIAKIPELNEFVKDEDLEAIRKLKK